MKNKIVSGLLLVAMIAGMFSFMSLGVSAEEGDKSPATGTDMIPSTSINYIKETMTTTAQFYAFAANKAKNAAPDKQDKAVAALKWYPVYNNTVDISKIIPKKNEDTSAKQYFIALTDYPQATSDQVGYKLLKGRDDVKKLLTKTNVTYENNNLKLPNDKVALEYKVQDGVWKTYVSSATDLFPIDNFPLKTTISIRRQADINTPATAEFKISVQQPKGPSIKFAGKEGKAHVVAVAGPPAKPEVDATVGTIELTGFKSGVKYETKTIAGTVTDFPVGTNNKVDLTQAAPANILKEKPSADPTTTYIYIRVKGEGKTLMSQWTKVTIKNNYAIYADTKADNKTQAVHNSWK